MHPDRFSDDELRTLLGRVATLIYDGNPPADVHDHIEAALKARSIANDSEE